MTSGNPFFVAEVLATGDGDRVPSTVADAVLARVRRLDPATQALEQLAVVPSVVERWLVDALVAGGLAALAAAEEHGLLTVSPTSVGFRHELARRAVADSVPVARRVELNRRVLHALVGREGADLSRIVHHAAQAGDADAIVRYGSAGRPGRGRRRRPPCGRPLSAGARSPGAVRPGRACRAAGGIRRRVLHGQCLRGPDRRVGGGRAAPVAGRPAGP